MEEDEVDACPYCGSLIERGSVSCPNCEENIDEVNIDS